MTKRTIAIIMVCVLLVGGGLGIYFGFFFVPRSQTLRISNWDVFLDDDLIADFTTYMREKTGRRFRVVQNIHTSNEDLLAEIRDRGGDYDLIVPSDYMLDRMIRENRVQRLDLGRLHQVAVDAGTTDYSIVHNIAPVGQTPVWEFNPLIIDQRITDLVPMRGEHHYGVPYLFGTMGIMFDNSIPGLSDAIQYYGWLSLWANDVALTPTWHTFHPDFDPIAHADPDQTSPTLSRTVVPSVKDIGRENYALARLAMHRNDLIALSDDGMGGTDFTFDPAYRARLEELFGWTPQDGRTSFTEELSAVEAFLNRLPGNTLLEQGDQSMNQFMANNFSHQLGMEWSVSAVYAMYAGANGHRISYYIPREGTNLWVNNLAITRNARNCDAAYAFIEWINRPENAMDNMAYTGSSTPIIEASDGLYYWFTNHSDMFDTSTPEGIAWKNMFLDAYFPLRAASPEIMQRAAVMQFFGEGRDAMLEPMWRRVSF